MAIFCHVSFTIIIKNQIYIMTIKGGTCNAYELISLKETLKVVMHTYENYRYWDHYFNMLFWSN